jgi:hypothetical protein
VDGERDAAKRDWLISRALSRREGASTSRHNVFKSMTTRHLERDFSVLTKQKQTALSLFCSDEWNAFDGLLFCALSSFAYTRNTSLYPLPYSPKIIETDSRGGVMVSCLESVAVPSVFVALRLVKPSVSSC